MATKRLIFFAWLVSSLPAIGAAQTSQEVNEANNPLTPKITMNLQEIYVTSSHGLPDSDSNSGLLRGDYYLPLGFGVGKVWKLSGGTTLNFFAEPQWTAVHAGVAPEWQIFSGLNMRFPLTR